MATSWDSATAEWAAVLEESRSTGSAAVLVRGALVQARKKQMQTAKQLLAWHRRLPPRVRDERGNRGLLWAPGFPDCGPQPPARLILGAEQSIGAVAHAVRGFSACPALLEVAGTRAKEQSEWCQQVSFQDGAAFQAQCDAQQPVSVFGVGKCHPRSTHPSMQPPNVKLLSVLDLDAWRALLRTKAVLADECLQYDATNATALSILAASRRAT